MFAGYARLLDVVLEHRLLTVGSRASALLARRSCRALARCCAASSSPRSTPAPSRCTSAPRAAPASRRPRSKIAQVEEFIKKTIPEHDLELFISEIGVNADWSAAYTPNSGPMDAVVKVQLTEHREPLGPGVRPPAPHGRRRRTRGSATWTSPSTPAA